MGKYQTVWGFLNLAYLYVCMEVDCSLDDRRKLLAAPDFPSCPWAWRGLYAMLLWINLHFCFFAVPDAVVAHQPMPWCRLEYSQSHGPWLFLTSQVSKMTSCPPYRHICCAMCSSGYRDTCTISWCKFADDVFSFFFFYFPCHGHPCCRWSVTLHPQEDHNGNRRGRTVFFSAKQWDATGAHRSQLSVLVRHVRQSRARWPCPCSHVYLFQVTS